MKQLGTHLVADAWQSPGDLLNDPERIRRAILDAIEAGGATPTLAESHIAIHTWPEHGYFAADLFFCGAGDPHKAMKVLQTALEAKQVKLTEFTRGFEPGVGILGIASEEQYAPRLVETSAVRG
jgi:S-adenosylmethionine decarboxylase